MEDTTDLIQRIEYARSLPGVDVVQAVDFVAEHSRQDPDHLATIHFAWRVEQYDTGLGKTD